MDTSDSSVRAARIETSISTPILLSTLSFIVGHHNPSLDPSVLHLLVDGMPSSPLNGGPLVPLLHLSTATPTVAVERKRALLIVQCEIENIQRGSSFLLLCPRLSFSFLLVFSQDPIDFIFNVRVTSRRSTIPHTTCKTRVKVCEHCAPDRRLLVVSAQTRYSQALGAGHLMTTD